MTAVTMLFEMTRDYDIVMPTIMAVALALGVRRLLSREDIYTIKLVESRPFRAQGPARQHVLVRPASDVMQRDPVLLPADADFSAFLRDPAYAGGMKHVVVTRGERLVGVIRVNMELHCGVEQADPGVRVGDIAQKNFVIAHENDVMFDIVSHMARRRASTTVVIADKLRPRAQNVVGIITREHIGDSVAEGLRPYG